MKAGEKIRIVRRVEGKGNAKCETTYPLFAVFLPLDTKKGDQEAYDFLGRGTLEHVLTWLQEKIDRKEIENRDSIEFTFDARGNHVLVSVGWFVSRWTNIISDYLSGLGADLTSIHDDV